MAKKISILLAVIVVVVSFLCTAQADEKKGMKTVTLPNGEVIWDISGEWDGFMQYTGVWVGSCGGTLDEKVNITQDGSSLLQKTMTWKMVKFYHSSLKLEIYIATGHQEVSMNRHSAPMMPKHTWLRSGEYYCRIIIQQY